MQNRIREARKAKNMTMKQLGTSIGVLESAVSNYERGQRQPDGETLCRIADVLGASVDFLLGRDPEPAMTVPVVVASSAPALTEQQERVLSLFDRLVPEDQYLIIGQMQGMLTAERYQKQERAAANAG